MWSSVIDLIVLSPKRQEQKERRMRLIDADALLKRMQEDPLFDLVERYGVSGVINAEPTVDAEPVRHGKWLYIRTDENENGVYECSECHMGEKHSPTVYVRYCWNCGARMDGTERKEE